MEIGPRSSAEADLSMPWSSLEDIGRSLWSTRIQIESSPPRPYPYHIRLKVSSNASRGSSEHEHRRSGPFRGCCRNGIGRRRFRKVEFVQDYDPPLVPRSPTRALRHLDESLPLASMDTASSRTSSASISSRKLWNNFLKVGSLTGVRISLRPII